MVHALAISGGEVGLAAVAAAIIIAAIGVAAWRKDRREDRELQAARERERERERKARERVQANQEEHRQAAERRKPAAPAISTAPPSSPPAASPHDPDSWRKWDDYPTPPWPTDVRPQDWNVDPHNGTRVYSAPHVTLNDGVTFVRVYIYAQKVDGTPAAFVPFIFRDGGGIPVLSGEVGFPYLEGDVYPWNNPNPSNPDDVPVALTIESDKDEDYAPYTPRGAWTDDFGEWEGIIRLAKPTKTHEMVTLIPLIGGRSLGVGSMKSVPIQFRDEEWFRANPDFLAYLPDRVLEEKFEDLARTVRGGRGEPSGLIQEKVKPTK